MLSIHVSQHDWVIAKEYWSQLTLNNAFNDDSSKIDFLNKHIFSSGSITSTESVGDIIPSVTTISELMNEIENETKSNVDRSGNGVTKKDEIEENAEISMINRQENQTMKQFMQKPV